MDEQITKIKNSNNNYIKAYNSKNSKFIKLGNWLVKESRIFINEGKEIKLNNNPNFKHGEIVKVDFGVNVGSELSNIHFAIVINNDDNNKVNNITVIPISSKKGYKRVSLGTILLPFDNGQNKYNKESYALITQIKTISKKRIIKEKIKISV